MGRSRVSHADLGLRWRCCGTQEQGHALGSRVNSWALGLLVLPIQPEASKLSQGSLRAHMSQENSVLPLRRPGTAHDLLYSAHTVQYLIPLNFILFFPFWLLSVFSLRKGEGEREKDGWGGGEKDRE